MFGGETHKRHNLEKGGGGLEAKGLKQLQKVTCYCPS